MGHKNQDKGRALRAYQVSGIKYQENKMSDMH